MFVAYKFDEGKNTKTKCGVLENFVKQNCLDSGNFREQKTGEIDPKQNFVFALADQISFIQFILQFDEGKKKKSSNQISQICSLCFIQFSWFQLSAFNDNKSSAMKIFSSAMN